jgi:hypothetical protein
VQLIPATFECPTHHLDLTDLVEEKLGHRTPYAYITVAFSAARPQAFEVVVTCPGIGQDETHELTCTGRYR